MSSTPSLLDTFPIDLTKFKKITLDPTNPTLTASQTSDLKANIQLFRDAIVCFTATAAARGVSGHAGGAYDTAPEVCMLLAIFNHSEKFYPVIFDEAGHRVATQYLLAALEGFFPSSHLLHYREAYSKLPGHPELGLTPGIKFSSGRLGHMWPLVNGIALAHRTRTLFLLGSDGSQQEGNTAEAARFAVAQGLDVKLIVDDNDVTISGHPSVYLGGTFDVGRTLEGHGVRVVRAQGEDVDAVWRGICSLVSENGPAALVLKRIMAPGIPDIEGSTHAHDVIPVASALKYLSSCTPNASTTSSFPTFPSHSTLSLLYSSIHPSTPPPSSSSSSPTASPLGSTSTRGANRIVFGEAVCSVLSTLASEEERKRRVLVVDSDLEGSTGLKSVREGYPEVFVSSGIMERGNLSAAAGFGFTGLGVGEEGVGDRGVGGGREVVAKKDGEEGGEEGEEGEEGEVRTGVFSTFSAFLEMVLSEVTMARLDGCNLLCHFSHSGVDEVCIEYFIQ
ncbi:Transketolase [Hypsizygus marmoreus]|uniref:Transketolase n=1 Tax=Hypsizygus marmoreus TaxID=39966 RepID=A0A369JUJ0_HYPMA|nr:Transketolase [Hypsizygus marmoreus]